MEDGVEKYNEAHFANGCCALMAKEWVGREPGTAASAPSATGKGLQAVERTGPCGLCPRGARSAFKEKGPPMCKAHWG